MEPGPETGILKLPLEDMAARHPGLTYFIAGYYLEAARVCLDRHHTSPTDFSFQNDQEEGITTVQWETTGAQTRGAHNNETDATTRLCPFECRRNAPAFKWTKSSLTVNRVSDDLTTDISIA